MSDKVYVCWQHDFTCAVYRNMIKHLRIHPRPDKWDWVAEASRQHAGLRDPLPATGVPEGRVRPPPSIGMINILSMS